ncbi:MAG TPA: DUF2877 domain-containing protein [Anaerolineales bacterium]
MEDWKVGRLEERPIEAKLLMPRSWEWVEETRWARVLHVFERSCNLVNDRGEILSLVTSELDAGPFAIVVSRSVAPFGEWVAQNAQVRVRADELVLCGRSISLRIAEEWYPRPPWEQLRTGMERLVTRLPDVNDLLQLHAPANGFAELANLGGAAGMRHPSPVVDRISVRILEAALSPATCLCEGIIKNDSALITQGAGDLAGLGGGLTPSGDDYMMGAIYAAWLLHSAKKAESIATKIVACAAPRTTRLSTAWLRAAQRGEAGMRWHLLLTALLSGDYAALASAVLELVSVGHTSGADALAGLLAVLNLHQQFSSAGTVRP